MGRFQEGYRKQMRFDESLKEKKKYLQFWLEVGVKRQREILELA